LGCIYIVFRVNEGGQFPSRHLRADKRASPSTANDDV